MSSLAADYFCRVLSLPILMQAMVGLVTLATSSVLAQSGSSAGAISPPQAAGGPHECRTHYPRAAVLGREEGITVLAFHIAEDGRVKNIVVSKSSGYDVLDQASIACVSEWTYRPATQNGKPVDVVRSANIEWDLPRSPLPIGAHDCRTEAQQISTDRPPLIQFIIGADGHVKDVQLSQSTGNAVWDQSLIACIRTWQYQPGTVQGHTSDFVKQMPLAAFTGSTRN